MQIKWKIYYLCSLYIILWCTILFCALLYLVITNWPREDTIKYSSIIAVMLVVISFKSVLSIRGIGHYKAGTLHSKNERSLFITGFCIIVIFAVIGFFFCLFVIIPKDFTSYRDMDSRPPLNYSEILLDFSAFTTVPCSSFLAVFDLILLKAIRRQYNASLDTLGEHLHP